MAGGAVFEHRWIFGQWESNYIKQKPNSPSIEYLEHYALTAAVLTWQKLLINKRITIFCDNMGVVGMINSSSSSCKNCMYLLRMLTLNNLIHNRRIFAKYVQSQDNELSDSLSRLQFSHFWKLAGNKMNKCPSEIAEAIYPPSKIWQR